MKEVRSQVDSWRPSLRATSVGLKGLAFWTRCGDYAYLLDDPQATWWRRGRAGVVYKAGAFYSPGNTQPWRTDDPLQWCCGCAFAEMPDLYAFAHCDDPETTRVLWDSKEIGQIRTVLPNEPMGLLKSIAHVSNNGVYRYSVHCGELLGHIDRPACVSNDQALLFLELLDGQRLPIVASQWTAGGRGNDDLVIPDEQANLTEPQLVMYFMINVLFRVYYLTFDLQT